MYNHSESDKQIKGSIRFHLICAGLLVVILVGGVGLWGGLMEIRGAIIAPGTIVVETNTKNVQHMEGGIVRSIMVTDGDTVDAGDTLLRLDDTVTRANLAVVTKQLDNLYSQEARLIAERDGEEEILFSTRATDDAHSQVLNTIQEGQRRMMVAKTKNLRGRQDQMRAQIQQYRKQIDGLSQQRDAKEIEISLIDGELEDLNKLLAKRLVTESRVTALKREKTKLQGEYGDFIAQVAKTEEAIAERNIQIMQIEEDVLTKTLEQLQQVRAEVAQLEEKKIAAQDQLMRMEIKSPQSGTVHDLTIHTIGGVIAPGEVLMQVVPREDVLVIEAQVQPIDVDQLTPNQEATIRLPSFDQRTTPELTAQVKTISPDLLEDPKTGLSFYMAELTISEDQLDKLGGKNLVPGMPVEAFIQTENRTVISYIMKPMVDQIAHAMRE
ncbi:MULTISPECIES: HlyD family type I secretion periplasmic adaptor subunit [unclassified Pseudovibrio]|uniref:HlyD family type I secretion periplasmic adaptor subunit n=1 Tax=unclassified Pseudovibrio TaxID=2627060 RepID=UPI00070A5E10|nr:MULTISPECIES: HlyD family type I secretion periplasmic adaptor subunit [unclassified Pseudovibrio]KZK89167.1 Type I secretion system membrane fusion protein PrsE [Pseudovibrio sp. Ad5]KZL03299.1 Type I secretion system membrane fusion protein PrsE [Pseudovibrio sp. W74]KZL12247.1 Type I secretion system membrane fusion protein PrsE [Pseudovibrio sp. Ad14]